MFERNALWNLTILIGPAVLGAVFGVLIPGALSNPSGFHRASLAVMAVGFVAFAVTKVRTIRRGKTISFGSAPMHRWERWLYRVGYFLMALGAVMTAVLAVSTQLR